MVPGVEWCERDGKRYLRVDYTVAAAGPDQRVLVVVDERRPDGMTEVGKAGLAAYRKVHQPLRTRFVVAGMPRAATIMLRAYNAIGARGRLAGFQDEPAALDWLLNH